MSGLPYYHGSISAAQADETLKDMPVGTFLLRDSSHKHIEMFNQPYTITWVEEVGYASRRVWHQRIEYRNNRYNLEEEVDSFKSIPELINYYKTDRWPMSPKCINPFFTTLQQMSVNVINDSLVNMDNPSVPIDQLKKLYKIDK